MGWRLLSLSLWAELLQAAGSLEDLTPVHAGAKATKCHWKILDRAVGC
jgi:hypothetical protein